MSGFFLDHVGTSKSKSDHLKEGYDEVNIRRAINLKRVLKQEKYQFVDAKNTYFQNHCNFLLAQKQNYLEDIRTDPVVAFLRCELKWPNTCRSELLFHSKIPRTVAKQIQSPAVILSMD